MILLPISQGVYTSSVVLFQVSGGEGMIILPVSQAVFTHPVILLLISCKGEDITPHIAEGV